jgi:hypothetical protein
MTKLAEALRERIAAYLSGGGLFNPELANHEAVRDLLIDCRAALAEHDAATHGAGEAFIWPSGHAAPPAQPLPDHDNHHNALLCPYCNPDRLVLVKPGTEAAQPLNLKDKAVQKRLATQWGYVHAQPVALTVDDVWRSEEIMAANAEVGLPMDKLMILVRAILAAGSATVDIDAAVNRFLGWPLPKTFAPDCGISFDGRKDDEWNKNKTWPTGTNLFTAIEAKAMLEHALGGVAPVADGFAQECDDADELLRLLGFEPDDVRTDGGSINLPKVRSLLAERAAEPAPAPADEPPPLPTEVGNLCSWRIATTEQNVVTPSALIVPVYTADQMRARDDYWIAKLQAERAKP